MSIDVVVGSLIRHWASYPDAWLAVLSDADALVWGRDVPDRERARARALPPLADEVTAPSRARLTAAAAAVARLQRGLAARSGVPVSWTDDSDDEPEHFDSLDPVGMGALHALASRAAVDPGRALAAHLPDLDTDGPFDDPAIAHAWQLGSTRLANLRTIDVANLLLPVPLPHPWLGGAITIGSAPCLLAELHEVADLWEDAWPRDDRSVLPPDPVDVDPRHARMLHNLSALIAASEAAVRLGAVLFVVG